MVTGNMTLGNMTHGNMTHGNMTVGNFTYASMEDFEIIDYISMCEELTATFDEFDLIQEGLLSEHDAVKHLTDLIAKDDANLDGNVDFDEF